MFCTLHKYKRENAVTWYANYAPSHCDGVTDTDTVTARPGVAPGNGSIHKLLLYYRPHNMGLRLRHTSLFLTYVLAPLCAISNFNYEQLIRGTFRLPRCCMGGSVSGSPYCHRHLADYIFGAVVYSCKEIG